MIYKNTYKDIKVIKFCKVCKVEFRPARGSRASGLGLCYVHRKQFEKEYSKDRKWFKNLTPEKKKEYYQRQYKVWLKWVEKNKEKRRKQALESYHRNKDKHKDRKHRATKGQAVD